jgi:hypothetical protein
MAKTVTITDTEKFRVEATLERGPVLHLTWMWKDGRAEWLETVCLCGDEQIAALADLIEPWSKEEVVVA